MFSLLSKNLIKNAKNFSQFRFITTTGIIINYYSFSFIIRKFIIQGYEYINVEVRGDKQNVGLITLNRPKALNALCNGLIVEVAKALDDLERDKNIAAVVITGSGRAFAGSLKQHLSISDIFF